MSCALRDPWYISSISLWIVTHIFLSLRLINPSRPSVSVCGLRTRESVYEMQIIFIENEKERRQSGKDGEKNDKWFAFIFLCLMKNEITKRGKKAHGTQVEWKIEGEVENIRRNYRTQCASEIAFNFRLCLVASPLHRRDDRVNRRVNLMWIHFNFRFSFSLNALYFNGPVTHVETMRLTHQPTLNFSHWSQPDSTSKASRVRSVKAPCQNQMRCECQHFDSNANAMVIPSRSLFFHACPVFACQTQIFALECSQQSSSSSIYIEMKQQSVLPVPGLIPNLLTMKKTIHQNCST